MPLYKETKPTSRVTLSETLDYKERNSCVTPPRALDNFLDVTLRPSSFNLLVSALQVSKKVTLNQHWIQNLLSFINKQTYFGSCLITSVWGENFINDLWDREKINKGELSD